MGSETINVGVIGTGAIGGIHAENLMRRTIGARVVAVMDIDRERAAAGRGRLRWRARLQ